MPQKSHILRTECLQPTANVSLSTKLAGNYKGTKLAFWRLLICKQKDNTMSETENLDIKDVIKDVSRTYKTPKDIVADTRFNTAQKLKILKSWEMDQKRLLVSEGENMREPVETEGAAQMLQNIQSAKRQV